MADEALSIWSNENEGCAARAKRLYDVFPRYTEPGTVFCGWCCTPEEVRAITRTPLGLLDEESGRKLLWETADHWESAEQYRHYLPRVLECVEPHLRLYGEDDRLEWANGIATLKNSQGSVVPRWAKSAGDA